MKMRVAVMLMLVVGVMLSAVGCADIGTAAAQVKTDAQAAAQASGNPKAIQTANNLPTTLPAQVAQIVPVVNDAGTLVGHLQNPNGASSVEIILTDGSKLGKDAAPLAGPYAVWVGLAASLVGLLGSAIKNKRLSAAASANNDAVMSGIASGQIVVNDPKAAAMAANSIVAAHPMGDALVDAIAAAPTK